MRLPKTDLESILNADKLDEGETMEFRITSVRPEQPSEDYIASGQPIEDWEPSWVVSTQEIIGVENEKVDVDKHIGRRVDMWLISQKFGPTKLFALIKQKCKYAPNEGWENGIPLNEAGEQKFENLEGVTFKGRLRGYTDKNGEYKQEVRPLTY